MANGGGMTLWCTQVCTHLERLTSELEAAAHPALDALTNKVQAGHMLCSPPECNVHHIFVCIAYTAVLMLRILLVCVTGIVSVVTHVLFAAKPWYA